MRRGETAADQVWNDVLTEIVARFWILVVALQFRIQEIGGERVDPHAREGTVWLAGN